MRRRLRREGAKHAAHDGRLELAITCERCGQPILLSTGPSGVVLADRAAFLEVHARCLAETRLSDSPDVG